MSWDKDMKTHSSHIQPDTRKPNGTNFVFYVWLEKLRDRQNVDAIFHLSKGLFTYAGMYFITYRQDFWTD